MKQKVFARRLFKSKPNVDSSENTLGESLMQFLKEEGIWGMWADYSVTNDPVALADKLRHKSFQRSPQRSTFDPA